MGNCPASCNNSIISFEYESEDKKTDIILTEKSLNSKDKKDKILENVKKDEKILEILNKLIYNIGKIDDDEIIALKVALKPILSKNYENHEQYLKLFEGIKRGSMNYKKILKIAEIFKTIYSKKNELDEKDIQYFIESINKALNQNNIIDCQLLEYLVGKLNKIFLDKSLNESESKKINNDLNNKSNGEASNEINIDKNFREKSFNKLNGLGEFERILSGNVLNIKDVEKALSSQKNKASNFSNYSKNSQNQILKMKDEIKGYKDENQKYKERIAFLENQLKENEKKIIKISYCDNDNGKEKIFFQIVADNEGDVIKSIEEFLKNNLELIRKKGIKKIKINNNEKNVDELIENESLNQTICTIIGNLL